jgi:hypothetical protein
LPSLARVVHSSPAGGSQAGTGPSKHTTR